LDRSEHPSSTAAIVISYEPSVQIDATAWRIRWTSDLPTPVIFRVFVEGVLVSGDAGLISDDGTGEWVLSVPPGEYPFFEVLDTECLPSIAFSGHLHLQWYGLGNQSYRVEKYISGTWTLQETIQDDGRGYYTWRTPWLADVTIHEYRIVPISLAGNSGTELSLVCLMLRAPDAPAVDVTYNGPVLGTIHIASTT
jgi:hypothetical protein